MLETLLLHYSKTFLACTFVPVSLSECPSKSVLQHMEGCTMSMRDGQQCNAKGPLPDGNINWNINNCPTDNFGLYEVFKCVKSSK
jgi:hypothetical protein